MNSDALIQSYVRHGDKWFFVSTMNRESSALAAYGMVYAETLVWEWDAEKRERGRIVAQGEGGQDSIYAHLAMCKRIAETGSPEGQEE
jgi:hypothetical protein